MKHKSAPLPHWYRRVNPLRDLSTLTATKKKVAKKKTAKKRG